jgi:phosphoribosylglycinamide formyltransferase-1
MNKMDVVVLIGGSGSNLQALIDSHIPNINIRCVISHNPEAYGLIRAQIANLPTMIIDHKAYSRPDFETALLKAIQKPNLVILAGFMRILSPEFMAQLPCPMLNIHPSLLPKYKGIDTHARALAANETEHGASIHFVTAELDGGPIVAQKKVPILPNDSPETLAKRTLEAEHILYPQVISWFAQQRLTYQSEQVLLDGAPLEKQGVQL